MILPKKKVKKKMIKILFKMKMEIKKKKYILYKMKMKEKIAIRLKAAYLNY